MASPILQVRRGPASNIGIASLRAGEPGFTTDQFDFYIGLNGTAADQKFFGSSRYWERETGSVASKLRLVDKDGSTGIHLKAPDTLAGIGTYTFPDTSTINPGYFLRVGAGGTLSWESVTSSASFENSTLSGNTTISGNLTNSANTSNSGITTFSNSTDNTLGNPNTGAVQIDGGVGIEKNLTVGAGLSVAGESHFIGTATFYGGTINLGDSDTDDVVFGGEIKSNLIPTDDATYDIGSGAKRWRNASFSGVGTFSSIHLTGSSATTGSTTFNLINDTATNVNLAGSATALNMGASTGIATINNATLTLPNATTVNVDGANPTLASSSSGTLTLFNSNITKVDAFQAATDIVIGAETGVTTFRNSVRVTDSLYDSSNSSGNSGQFLISTATGIGWTTISGVAAGTISTAARSETIDITDKDSGTVRILFGNTGTGSTVYNNGNLTFNASTNTLNSQYLSVSGDIKASTIKAYDGTSSLSISNTTGDVVANSNFTVTGNLTVNGSTTQVNTTELQVYDRTITLGIQTGATDTTTTWDLGILMNYGDAGVAKTAGMIWDYATRRFRFGIDTDNPAGTSTTTPQIGITSYAAIEIAELWIHNDCSGGAQQVIHCYDSGSGSELQLRNITIDAGGF